MTSENPTEALIWSEFEGVVFITHAYVPFLGLEAEISAIKKGDATGPGINDIETVGKILAYCGDLRTPLIEATYSYYQSEIYGSFQSFDNEGNDITETVAPPLTEPAQIWPMLSKPEIHTWIYSQRDTDIRFAVAFECPWDKEHGFSALIEDWQITEVGDVL